MTVVYPLTTQLDHTELKYSLRSIEKYLQLPYEVVIVGDNLPDWINNVTQIHLSDVPGRKQISIKRKILAALQYSEEIFFMNDDIYLLQPTDPKRFPYYYFGQLRTIRESGVKPLQDKLELLNKPLKHFDVHTPILYKQDFREVITNFSPNSVIKSAYGNFLEINGIELRDCKIMKLMTPQQVRNEIKGRPCFSTGPAGLKYALPVLEELFPMPSQFEVASEDPLINVLIRTSNRPDLFNRCYSSITSQTYKNVRVIVSSDTEINYIPKSAEVVKVEPDKSCSYFWNLYCNSLMQAVNEGWFFFLDDDDYLADKRALEGISKFLLNQDEAVICQFKRGYIKKPNDLQMKEKKVVRGWVGMPCIFLHESKKNIVEFDGKPAADYRFIKQVSEKIETKWVSKVVVQTDRSSKGKN